MDDYKVVWSRHGDGVYKTEVPGFGERFWLKRIGDQWTIYQFLVPYRGDAQNPLKAVIVHKPRMSEARLCFRAWVVDQIGKKGVLLRQ